MVAQSEPAMGSLSSISFLVVGSFTLPVDGSPSSLHSASIRSITRIAPYSVLINAECFKHGSSIYHFWNDRYYITEELVSSKFLCLHFRVRYYSTWDSNYHFVLNTPNSSHYPELLSVSPPVSASYLKLWRRTVSSWFTVAVVCLFSRFLTILWQL